MRRSRLAALVLLLCSLLLVPVSPAGAATPYCGIRWGSLDKSVAGLSLAPVTDVRTGRHTCFDRLVVDIAGDARGYTVRYVPAVTADGSGVVIPTRGGAALEITVCNPAFASSGAPTYTPADRRELRDVTGYRTFRQVVWAGTFEGYMSLGLGVRARLPFRAFLLDGPGTSDRLVVDVAHRW
ncbi:AMIN-like domain-containing (lipo)protein [Cellulomonas endometrii]|jgi:hypothetical protein|uniref:AMIN-like domain-containing (lipo)protein n=1 Tax=Cellulomonas endometrii TaxID=3036301 RepID=UPI0024AE116B|nr:hypothetical protein [Cellulomonas endometrii]